MALSRKLGYVIGIDPDIEKNGVACIDRNHRILRVQYLNFPETLEWVKKIYNVFSFEAGESQDENQRRSATCHPGGNGKTLGDR